MIMFFSIIASSLLGVVVGYLVSSHKKNKAIDRLVDDRNIKKQIIEANKSIIACSIEKKYFELFFEKQRIKSVALYGNEEYLKDVIGIFPPDCIKFILLDNNERKSVFYNGRTKYPVHKICEEIPKVDIIIACLDDDYEKLKHCMDNNKCVLLKTLCKLCKETVNENVEG